MGVCQNLLSHFCCCYLKWLSDKTSWVVQVTCNHTQSKGRQPVQPQNVIITPPPGLVHHPVSHPHMPGSGLNPVYAQVSMPPSTYLVSVCSTSSNLACYLWSLFGSQILTIRQQRTFSDNCHPKAYLFHPPTLTILSQLHTREYSYLSRLSQYTTSWGSNSQLTIQFYHSKSCFYNALQRIHIPLSLLCGVDTVRWSQLCPSESSNSNGCYGRLNSVCYEYLRILRFCTEPVVSSIKICMLVA